MEAASSSARHGYRAELDLAASSAPPVSGLWSTKLAAAAAVASRTADLGAALHGPVRHGPLPLQVHAVRPPHSRSARSG